MTIRLNGATSGYTEIDAPNAAGNNKLILPTGNGSASQYLQSDGAGTLSWNDPFRMVLATAQNSTSGTSIDFTGIPSWVKRVTVMFNGVSTNGTSNPIVQLGISSGPVTSGYTAYYYAAGFSTGYTVTAGFLFGAGFAANTVYGHLLLTNVSGNIWVSSTNAAIFDGTNRTGQNGGGTVTLSSTLDRIRITTVNGTDTFDAGSINIMYEG